MDNSIFEVPKPENEPILSYAPGSKEKVAIEHWLKKLKDNPVEIPLFIGNRKIKTNYFGDCYMPHDHKNILGKYHEAKETEVVMAINTALEARKTWSEMPWESRASIFLKAAELLSSNPWRYIMNAATMLCQSKTVFQAEIDAACELIDFFRFNVYYAQEIYKEQPIYSPGGIWNRLEHRPLEGFVFTVTPFNFTSIAANLPCAPALMGNTVVWKPSSTAVYSAYFIMKLLEEAGLPDGVINMIPGSGKIIGPQVLRHPDLAGVHFTGSTKTFQSMWKTIGENIERYKSYPRIVGETGGKDFIFVHESASENLKELSTAIIRGAFEYQGQKCSAASRAYIPASIWPRLKYLLTEGCSKIKMGDPEDFTNFMCAVIDRKAFNKITGYIDYVRKSEEAEIIVGGGYNSLNGFFIEPTIILTDNLKFKTMQEEIFGPVMTIYLYANKDYEKTLHLCDETSPYALTGAIFARDREAINLANKILVNAAGNFYINDKPTGAVVGQQPFGGGRASGTNDKAGSKLNLLRWVSPRTIKETFYPPVDFTYPHMAKK